MSNVSYVWVSIKCFIFRVIVRGNTWKWYSQKLWGYRDLSNMLSYNLTRYLKIFQNWNLPPTHPLDSVGSWIRISIKLCTVSIDCASPVLLYCLQVFTDGFSKTKTIETKSSMFDLVTEYDKKVEQMLIEEISNKFPSHK